MTTLICIDPGTRECGVAVFYRGKLEAAWLSDGSAERLYKPDAPRILVERPEYQGARTDKARTQDTMALCWAGAKLAYRIAGATGGAVKEVTPSEWKGQSPKPVTHVRTWDILSTAERLLLGGDATHAVIRKALEKGAARRWPAGFNPYPKSATIHNVLDAVAMGCVELDRVTLGGTAL